MYERITLYINFLDRTLHKLGLIRGVDTFIVLAPEDSGEYFQRYNVKLIPLHEGDLGVRMLEAFREVFSCGYQKAALVGVDIHDLTASIILRSFDVLNENGHVYGPASDGGYYLVGMRKLI